MLSCSHVHRLVSTLGQSNTYSRLVQVIFITVVHRMLLKAKVQAAMAKHCQIIYILVSQRV